MCQYCDFGKRGKFKGRTPDFLILQDRFAVKIEKDEPYVGDYGLTVSDNEDECEFTVAINFCPKCGRRLANLGLESFAPKPSTDKRLRENRANVRKASRKYSATPKGKLTNSQKCMIYQRNHPEKVKGYVMRYQAKWKAAHGGINMCAWNYWKRRLDRGEIAPEEVPEKYEICLNEWRKK